MEGVPDSSDNGEPMSLNCSSDKDATSRLSNPSSGPSGPWVSWVRAGREGVNKGDSHLLLSGSNKPSAAGEVASVGFGSLPSSSFGILRDWAAWASASGDSEAWVASWVSSSGVTVFLVDFRPALACIARFAGGALAGLEEELAVVASAFLAVAVLLVVADFLVVFFLVEVVVFFVAVFFLVFVDLVLAPRLLVRVTGCDEGCVSCCWAEVCDCDEWEPDCALVWEVLRALIDLV